MIMAHQGPEASIARIAGAGFRLSLLLNAAACQLAQSRIEIHSIAKGISLFALTLKHVGQTLEAADVDRSPEAMEKAWEIAGQGQMVFTEIEHMLDKLKGTDADDELKNIPVQERLKWCFRKQHVTYLLAQLEFLKLSLIVLLRVLQLGNLAKSSPDSISPTLVADDVVAQEKAETQNMIIVRYWSGKRLDRLWDLVEQEALDAANDQTNQMINSNYAPPNTASALRPLVAAAKGSDLTRLPVVSFGDADVNLNNIERSPKDMVQLSESTMNHLLSIWVPSLDPNRLRDAGKLGGENGKSSRPRVYISSDTEDDLDGSDFEGHDVRGYYLEGKTDDWRKPQSQEARQRAAQLRKQYSSYQAHVESDADTDSFLGGRHGRWNNQRGIGSSDDREQRSDGHRPSNEFVNGGRAASIGGSPRYPPSPSTSFQNLDSRQPAPYSSSNFPPANQGAPRQPAPPHVTGPPQQPHRQYTSQDYASPPRSIPMSQPKPSSTMPNPSPRGTPPGSFESWGRAPGFNGNKLQPRHQTSAYPLSSSSPESGWSSPSRSAQRSPSHPARRSSREDAKERQKKMTRSATRGLAGIGAIAGFMDALEAFHIF